MTSNDYARVARAIRFLEDHAREQPSLGDVARAAGLSPYHFQRVFRRWAGVSPKRFLQYLTAQHAKGVLRDGGTTLDAAFDAGLSGPGRLHDLMVNVEAATPGEVRGAGVGLEIRWGTHLTPFGPALIALTPRGVCHLSFGPQDEALDVLRNDWPAARLARDQARTESVATRIFGDPTRRSPLTLHLKGTNFQLKVWEGLLHIPPGTTTTYAEVAEAVGRPRAVRAVGNAVGANRVAFVIPCHRVLRSTGALGGYRWGTERKRAMLVWEGVRQ